MLEAMQEQKVTVVGKTFHLPPPFLVLATQNPVEQEGTYPLPEAQLDRFMFLIELDYPSEEEEIRIARTTTGDELAVLNQLLHAEEIVKLQDLVRRVPVPDHIYSYAARLVRKTRPSDPTTPAWLKPLVAWGAGPRRPVPDPGSQSPVGVAGKLHGSARRHRSRRRTRDDSPHHHDLCGTGRRNRCQADREASGGRNQGQCLNPKSEIRRKHQH